MYHSPDDLDPILEDGDLELLRAELECANHEKEQLHLEQEIIAQDYHLAECEFVSAKLKYKKDTADVEHRKERLTYAVDRLLEAIKDREISASAQGDYDDKEADADEGDY